MSALFGLQISLSVFCITHNLLPALLLTRLRASLPNILFQKTWSFIIFKKRVKCIVDPLTFIHVSLRSISATKVAFQVHKLLK